MPKQNINRRLDKLFEIIVSAVLGVAGEKTAVASTLWPLPTPRGLLYWQKEWTEKLYHTIRLIEKRSVRKDRIKTALMSSSRPAQLLWRVDAIKDSDLNLEQKLYIIHKLFDYLTLFRKRDLFCEKGENLIWNKEELKSSQEGLKFFSVDNDKLINDIGILETTLWLYTELIYWTNHPFGHSFHGPYEVRGGSLLVREYLDLKPEIWSFSRDLKFSQVEIFEIYEKTNLELDFFERGIRSTKDFRKNLRYFALKVDGKIVETPRQILQYTKNLTKVAKFGSKANQSLNQQQLIEKHAQIWFYAIKPLCDLVKENWHLPKGVLDNIYKKYEEIDIIWKEIERGFKRTSFLPHGEREKFVKATFDPRK